MNIFGCCCSNRSFIDDRQRHEARVALMCQLCEQLEEKIDLYRARTDEFVKLAKVLSGIDNAISLKYVTILYEKFGIDPKHLMTFFASPFFLVKPTSSDVYDSEKFVFFNLLYTRGSRKEKLTLLFELLAKEDKLLRRKDKDSLTIRLAILFYIPTKLQLEQILMNPSLDKELRTDLETLKSTVMTDNSKQLYDFAQFVVDGLIFP